MVGSGNLYSKENYSNLICVYRNQVPDLAGGGYPAWQVSEGARHDILRREFVLQLSPLRLSQLLNCPARELWICEID